ncbi:MAG: hypothetical protein ACYCPQ_03130 [Elusimicrobiota bacterium]
MVKSEVLAAGLIAAALAVFSAAAKAGGIEEAPDAAARAMAPMTAIAPIALLNFNAGMAQAAGINLAPAQIIIIRHGEKPETGNTLSPRGRLRAQALVGFFKKNPAVTRFGPPAAIYAMAPNSEDGSLRPIETVTPLAQSLGLPINENFHKKDLPGLAEDIMKNPSCAGRMVLVCWEHHMIPKLARQLGWDSAPQSWPGSVFDRAWILNFTGERVSSFQNIPENVLPGDSQRLRTSRAISTKGRLKHG